MENPLVIAVTTVSFSVDEHHLIGKLPLMDSCLKQMKRSAMLPLNAMY